jgi:hypothetical protein
MHRVDARMAPDWSGRSFLAPGVIVYIGRGGAANDHAHHAIQFVWGLDEPVQLNVAGRMVRAGATLIPAGTPHDFRADGRVALALIEPHGPRGATAPSSSIRTRRQSSSMVST